LKTVAGIRRYWILVPGFWIRPHLGTTSDI
jgi:hypothetical protein